MWKTKNFCLLFLILILTFITSCNNTVKWIDTGKWKKDYKGCDAYRTSLISVIKENKADLIGKTDAFFFSALGKANRVSYSTRGKKTFYYYLAPGSQCDNNTGMTTCLIIEFESLGTSRLIYLEEIQL